MKAEDIHVGDTITWIDGPAPRSDKVLAVTPTGAAVKCFRSIGGVRTVAFGSITGHTRPVGVVRDTRPSLELPAPYTKSIAGLRQLADMGIAGKAPCLDAAKAVGSVLLCDLIDAGLVAGDENNVWLTSAGKGFIE